MPIYSCTVRGDTKTRLVRADTAAQARNHIVDVEPLTAEQMADEIEKGAKIERAGAETPPAEDNKTTSNKGAE
jgi:hypothetical protein